MHIWRGTYDVGCNFFWLHLINFEMLTTCYQQLCFHIHCYNKQLFLYSNIIIYRIKFNSAHYLHFQGYVKACHMKGILIAIIQIFGRLYVLGQLTSDHQEKPRHHWFSPCPDDPTKPERLVRLERSEWLGFRAVNFDDFSLIFRISSLFFGDDSLCSMIRR